MTGTYDPDTNQTVWGTGNPVPMFDPTYRPGDNLFTNSAISWDPDSGKMNWYFQFTPGDMWDYDEVGTHIMIDGNVGGQQRKLITHSARNGFFYTMERANGAMVSAKPYLDNINWTKGIDQKTGKPLDYDPNKDIQTYSTVANQNPAHEPCFRSLGSERSELGGAFHYAPALALPRQTGGPQVAGGAAEAHGAEFTFSASNIDGTGEMKAGEEVEEVDCAAVLAVVVAKKAFNAVAQFLGDGAMRGSLRDLVDGMTDWAQNAFPDARLLIRERRRALAPSLRAPDRIGTNLD